MACPICKSLQFYIKDPSDEFEIHPFELHDGQIRFAEDEAPDTPDSVAEDHEIYCQTCSWHGKKKALQ